MEIRQLNSEDFRGKRFTARYTTWGYFDICADSDCFRLVYKRFPQELEKSFDDVFFSEWLEAPVAFGAFENDCLLGFIEGSREEWNNRFRISNLCVFNEKDRGKGIGDRLMGRILQTARESGARMAVLETQTCNEKAIAFYKKHGLAVIGFDLYAYSNQDLQRCEVRLEMGIKLTDAAENAVDLGNL